MSVHFHLDCFSGVAGDMMLAACLDASSNPAGLLQHVTQNLRQGLPAIANEFAIEKQRVHRGKMSCIAATYVSVRHLSVDTGEEVEDEPAPVPSDHINAPDARLDENHGRDHSHSHGHEHSHEHSHEHYHSHEQGHAHAHDHHETSSAPTATTPSSPPNPNSSSNGSHSHSHNHTINKENNNQNTNFHTTSSPLRNWKEIRQMLQEADPIFLPPWVSGMAISTFFELAKAEAFVHGATDPDAVHFHEVGSIDSIVDTVGSLLAMYALAQELVVVQQELLQETQSTPSDGVSTVVVPNITCSSSPVPMGEGTCYGMHGLMPVPAFATMRLLLGIPTCPGPVGVTGELVTPTGAALLRALTVASSSSDVGETNASVRVVSSQKKMMAGRPPHGFVPRLIGHGAGTKDFVKHANVLRILVGTL
eukprot:Nitzschia sp. Nitz4//NODE_491_length_15690_cov_71.798657//7349//8608//NITZ4_additional_000073-RA//1//CDS//3329531947//7978//frame0